LHQAAIRTVWCVTPKISKTWEWATRVTEVLLPQVSFKALKELFLSKDFARSRPYRPTQAPF